MEPTATAPAPDDPWTEILAAWALAIGLVYAAGRFLPAVASPFAATAAWIGVAVGFHVARGRSLSEAGLAWESPLRTLKLVAIYAAIFLPLYGTGFFALSGAKDWHFPGVAIPLVSFIAALFYAALPEEVFFRGFIQPRLAPLDPAGESLLPRRFPVPVTRAIAITAALFALTHVAFLQDPISLAALERLTTFFPGLLFGALRQKTGDIVAPALFHALCNATLYTLQHGYLT